MQAASRASPTPWRPHRRGMRPSVSRWRIPGFFPNADRARVLWIGVDGALRPLRQLQRDVDETLATLGFAAEKRPFNPHLTVARMRDSAPRADRRNAADALAAYPLPAGIAISANAVCLMQSELRPGGAVYTRIAHAPLSAQLHPYC